MNSGTQAEDWHSGMPVAKLRVLLAQVTLSLIFRQCWGRNLRLLHKLGRCCTKEPRKIPGPGAQRSLGDCRQ